jgi:hypothetical protein
MVRGVLVKVGVAVGVGVDVAAGGAEHQGAPNVKPSNIQVSLPPSLQIVWKTSKVRPGWNSSICPRSSGGGENRLVAPIKMVTA